MLDLCQLSFITIVPLFTGCSYTRKKNCYSRGHFFKLIHSTNEFYMFVLTNLLRNLKSTSYVCNSELKCFVLRSRMFAHACISWFMPYMYQLYPCSFHAVPSHATYVDIYITNGSYVQYELDFNSIWLFHSIYSRLIRQYQYDIYEWLDFGSTKLFLVFAFDLVILKVHWLN